MASSDKDLHMKLCTSAILRALGYTVFQEVDLCTYSYQPKYTRKQITDFDVLGISIEGDFGFYVAVAECKSLEEQAMEHLLKLNGVKEYFRANKAYFVQRKIDINAREVGRELGIWVLDEHNLSTLMSSIGVSEKPHVELETQVYKAKVKVFSQKKPEIKKIIDYLRYDFWTLPEHRNIINIIRLLNQASQHLKPGDMPHVIIAHQTAVNLAVAIMQLIREVVRHNIDDIREGALTRILGGARERRDREALFDTVAKLIPDSRLTSTPPFQENLVEVIARFINAASDAVKVVHCLDHMTRRLLSADVDKIYGTPEFVHGSRALKLSRDILLFLAAECTIPKDLFQPSLVDTGKESVPDRSA